MIDYMLNLAFFACGFSVAVIVFYDNIRLGVQIKREARKKAKEAVAPQ